MKFMLARVHFLISSTVQGILIPNIFNIVLLGDYKSQFFLVIATVCYKLKGSVRVNLNLY